MFPILQEGTTNALRHGDATRSNAGITRIGDQLQHRLSDNDSGIPPDVREGNGLTGMRERLSLWGGSMTLSRLSQGTVLDARLPIGKTDPQEDQQ